LDTSSYDNKIVDLNHQKDATLKEMESLYDKFIEATTNFTIKWSQKQIEKYVGENYHLTLTRNENELIGLKTEFKELINKLPAIVVGDLNDDKYWVHLHSPKNITKFFSDHSNYTRAFEELIKEPLRIIMGRVGILLNNYGYVTVQNSQSNWSSSYNDRKVRYVVRELEMDEEMKICLDNYLKNIIELKEIINKIKSAELDKEKFKAINRWKKIQID